MTHGRADFTARACVPKPGRVVIAPGQYAALIGRERGAVHHAVMYKRGANLTAGPRIPKSRRAVAAPREYAAFIAGERCTSNRAIVVAQWWANLLTSARIPNPRGMIGAPAQD